MRKGKFHWGKAQHDNFELIERKLTSSKVFACTNFDKLFEVVTDVSRTRVVLM